MDFDFENPHQEESDGTISYYLVGGALRNLLQGLAPRDFDFVYKGSAAQFLKTHPKALRAGQSHSVFIWKGHEYSALRAHDIHGDLAKRDLTINALALDENGILYLHPQALADLKSQTLRLASQTALLDDPVRVFRLARFKAELPSWTVAEDTQRLLASFPKDLLRPLAAERVANEVLKALLTKHAHIFFAELAHASFLEPWFQELYDLSCQSSPHLFTQTLTLLALVGPYPLSGWIVLCHRLTEEKASTLTKRLKLSMKFLNCARLSARFFTQALHYQALTTSQKCTILWTIDRAHLHNDFWHAVTQVNREINRTTVDEARDCIKSVHLPKKDCNLGPKSQEILHSLQCTALEKMPD